MTFARLKMNIVCIKIESVRFIIAVAAILFNITPVKICVASVPIVPARPKTKPASVKTFTAIPQIPFRIFEPVPNPMESNYKALLRKIKCFVFDVDGVLTNGSLILVPGGGQARTMNIRDGYALQHAIKNGFEVLILSGGKSEEVRTRLKGLGVKNIQLGCDDKLSALKNYLWENEMSESEVLYMGDDIPDLTAMKISGVASCPGDAAEEIKKICHYISPFKGGEGCVRDVIEQTMKVQGKWD